MQVVELSLQPNPEKRVGQKTNIFQNFPYIARYQRLSLSAPFIENKQCRRIFCFACLKLKKQNMNNLTLFHIRAELHPFLKDKRKTFLTTSELMAFFIKINDLSMNYEPNKF